MKQYSFFTILCLFFSSTWCFAATDAKISVIFSSDIKPYRQAWVGFKELFDDKKVSLLISEYNLKRQRPDEIIDSIAQKGPHVVFTIGTKATKFARKKIKDIPIVFSMVLTPKPFVDSNITGASLDIPAKVKLKDIIRILPHIKEIRVIYSSKSIQIYKEISRSAKELGFRVIGKEIESPKEFPDVLKGISRQADAFLMIPDTKIYFHKSIEYLLRESLREKFPIIGISSAYTKAGALVSFECDYKEIGRQAGEIALRIYNGEDPSNIQPSRPKKIRFSLNLLTAERLDIRIPPRIVKEASKVFGK